MACVGNSVSVPSVKVGVLVNFVCPDQAANDHFLWLIRERVALALQELGWLTKVAH